jgi:hypothetical protein
MKKLSIIILLLCSIKASGQSEFSKEAMIRFQATLATGAMIRNPVSPIYIHSNLEYYLDEQISIRGDFYFLLGSLEGNHQFSAASSTFAGISYHFIEKKSFDPYFSLQPGVAFVRKRFPGPDYSLNLSEAFSVNPLISVSAGFIFFATRYFHLFMDARYIHGKNLNVHFGTYPLDELIFSFGLGFNLAIRRL